ncbi:MAG: ATP-binding protein [Gammaproteobacteria bacterium]|nr:ATP-binding protein [Gammaproteobacteria bacterium]
MIGKKRNLYEKALKLLTYFPVVVILGARQTGKTTLSKQLRPDWDYFDLENIGTYSQISQDPELFFKQYGRHIILDEAQMLPDIFRTLRGVIDNAREEKGRFIITGSSSPELLSHISESLAGRVAIVELGTFKTNERFELGLSPFYTIFQQTLERDALNFKEKTALLTLDQVHTHWVYGGYPEPILNNSKDFYLLWMENYYKTYLSRDIGALFPKLNTINYQRFLMMLAKLSSTIINKSELARSIEVSEKSIRQYIHIAEHTFLWRSLPSYERDIQKAIVKMPKGYVRDSGLLHYLLNIDNAKQLYANPVVGHSFEAFVIDEIIKGIEASPLTNWHANYYRTRAGAEVDLILQGSFGVLPIEIKYGVYTPIKQLRSLETFVKEQQLPFGLLINQSDRPMWLSESVYQLPVTYL